MTSDTADSELDAYARSRIGTTLRGKYRINAVIGLGGMAVVYRATHRNQAEFAVKMLHPELSIREEVKTRFLREGYAANSVKHPGVVLVVDDDVAEDGAAFLVMELLDGVGCESLWEKHSGRMPVTAACSVAHQLLDVLSAAHAKGIVHRDLKPANLYVTLEGKIKVLDFGIARVRDVATKSATVTGVLLGTPAFMGPEQALAKASEVGAQTDLWAVGATLFTLISGSLVHEGENAQQIMIKAATQKARSLATVAPNVPAPIVAVVDRALRFEKSDRWENAAAMRDALGDACKLALGFPPSTAAIVAAMEVGAKRSGQATLPMPRGDSSPAATAPTEIVAAVSTGPGATLPLSASAPPPSLSARSMSSPLDVPGLMSTASPVSHGAPASSSKRGRGRVVIGVGLGVVVLGAVGFVAKSQLVASNVGPGSAAPPASTAEARGGEPSSAAASATTPLRASAETTPASASIASASPSPPGSASVSIPATRTAPLGGRPAAPHNPVSAAGLAPTTPAAIPPPSSRQEPATANTSEPPLAPPRMDKVK